jgi:predicted PurR-regulated permease PerM
MSFSSSRVETSVAVVWRLILRLWWRVVVIAGAVYAGYRLRTIIITICVSAIIAYVLDPAVEWACHQPRFTRFHSNVFTLNTRIIARLLPRSKPLHSECKHHTIRLCAAAYVFILALLLLWQGGRLVLTPFASEIRKVTSKQGQEELKHKKDDFIRWYDSTVPEWMQSDKLQDQMKRANLSEPLQRAISEVGRTLVEAAKSIVEIVLIPVLAFYVLIDGRRLKHEFVGLLPRSSRREAVRTLNEFNRIMRAYISGQFILCILAGVIVGIWLVLLHTKYPFTLAVFAGLTRAIPVVGPIFGGIPIVLLVLADPDQGPGVALAFVVFFSILHFVETKFIMPLLIGDRIELHPVLVIVVLLIGGEAGALLLGNQLGALLGMFFAAPLAALVRVLVRRYWLHLPPGPHRPCAAAAPEEAPVARVAPERVQ